MARVKTNLENTQKKIENPNFLVKMTEEQSTPVTETVSGTHPKDLSQVVQGTAENLLNKLEENLGEQKGKI